MTERLTLDALERELRDESYPMTVEDVQDAYGDCVLDLPGGEAVVADVLARVDSGQFEDHADAVASVEVGIGGEGVGRRDYTDRGASAGGDDQQSF